MRKEKRIFGWFAAAFLLLCVCVWLHPSSEASKAERRKLSQMPELRMELVADGTFMERFEDYALDQFPFRDQLRSLKAWISQKIFRRADNHEIYVSDGYAVKMEYPLNEASVEHATDKFAKIYEKYLKAQGCRIYSAVIPDKNFFLAEQSGHLSMDYERLFSKVQEAMPYAEWIDLTEVLDITDYYYTDIHWRQEKLTDVAEKVGDVMGIRTADAYETKTLENKFYGVYFGQSALNLQGEQLSYLTNPVLEQCSVYNYETGETTGIYDGKKAEGDDPYELFLSGPVSLLRIDNPSAETDRDLIVFRDSFGSSLIPLLAEDYRTITLVDIRYIQSGILGKFVEFAGKDVLFLYSTNVLNHSETFK